MGKLVTPCAAIFAFWKAAWKNIFARGAPKARTNFD
jgi:hypothetical protein